VPTTSYDREGNVTLRALQACMQGECAAGPSTVHEPATAAGHKAKTLLSFT